MLGLRMRSEDLEDDDELPPSHSALWLALRPLDEATFHASESDEVRLRAGWLGIGLGLLIGPAGFLVGVRVLFFLLHLVLGDSYEGQVRVPRIVILLVFGIAIWGGLMLLVGMLRIVEVSAPRLSRLFMFLVAPLLAVGLLLALFFGLWPLFG